MCRICKASDSAPALDIRIGDVQAADVKPCSHIFVKNNLRARVRCMFTSLAELISREGINCSWHLSAGGKFPCHPAGHIHEAIGSGSCHPHTTVATRDPECRPESHPDHGMLFDKDG